MYKIYKDDELILETQDSLDIHRYFVKKQHFSIGYCTKYMGFKVVDPNGKAMQFL
jgi:hypothetical protein